MSLLIFHSVLVIFTSGILSVWQEEKLCTWLYRIFFLSAFSYESLRNRMLATLQIISVRRNLEDVRELGGTSGSMDSRTDLRKLIVWYLLLQRRMSMKILAKNCIILVFCWENKEFSIIFFFKYLRIYDRGGRSLIPSFSLL